MIWSHLLYQLDVLPNKRNVLIIELKGDFDRVLEWLLYQSNRHASCASWLGDSPALCEISVMVLLYWQGRNTWSHL